MVLISVDFPQPFGPRMATCSPSRIESVIPSRAIFSPRYTVTLLNSINGSIQAQARLEIKSIPGREKVVRLAVLIDRDFTRSDNFEFVALHHYGGLFVYPDAEQIGVRLHDGNQ